MKKQYHRQIVQTGDGSSGIFLPGLNEHYHSVHGALQESVHVFIREGFEKLAARPGRVDILEVGLGTGLNCLLTALKAMTDNRIFLYTALEPYPLTRSEYTRLNYPLLLKTEEAAGIFNRIHACRFGHVVSLWDGFGFMKHRQTIQEADLPAGIYRLVYYDAFGPQVAPEMWHQELFEKIYASMADGGVLVTYCARGSVKRALKASGFKLEHPAGPPGKREITRGVKG